MPGVRYGPDIADDAAYIMNNLVSINKRQRDLEKKGKKLTVKESRNKDKLASLADGIFGVSRADIDKNKFGEMGQMAQYSSYGRSTRGKAYKRSKIARDARTGKIRGRELAKEHKLRSEGKVSRGVTKDASGGASYLGRTKTKKFTQLHDRAASRAASNKIKVGKARVTNTQPESIDNLHIANVRGGSLGRNAAALSKSGSLRPPKVSSVSRRTQGGRSDKPTPVKKASKPKTPRTTKKKK